MLVSLSIKNFKSIREAHVRFGPFTCFIGHNGVGKSNLFDAIHFLSALTDRDISDAATEVRRASDGGYSPLDLVFGRDPGRTIELSADMVVPPQVADDFGESAKPSETEGLQELHRFPILQGIQEIHRSGRALGRAPHLHQTS